MTDNLEREVKEQRKLIERVLGMMPRRARAGSIEGHFHSADSLIGGVGGTGAVVMDFGDEPVSPQIFTP